MPRVKPVQADQLLSARVVQLQRTCILHSASLAPLLSIGPELPVLLVFRLARPALQQQPVLPVWLATLFRQELVLRVGLERTTIQGRKLVMPAFQEDFAKPVLH